MPYFCKTQNVDAEMDISVVDFCRECSESELDEIIEVATDLLKTKHKKNVPVSVHGTLEDEYKDLLLDKAKKIYNLKELEEKFDITRY